MREFLRETRFPLHAERLKGFPLDQVDRLVLVDVKRITRIGPMRDIVGRAGLEIHIYDHHPAHPKDIAGSLEVLREVGATTTILLDLLRQQELPLTPQEATLFALGIYEETGLLTFTNTTEADLQAAAYCLSRGANLSLVSDFIRRELTADQVGLLNELIKSAETYTINGVRVVISTASLDRYVGDLAMLTHKLRDMENINVLFTLVRMDNRVHMVARSRLEAVDVGEIADAFGGGGHVTAVFRHDQGPHALPGEGAIAPPPERAGPPAQAGAGHHDGAREGDPGALHAARSSRDHEPVQPGPPPRRAARRDGRPDHPRGGGQGHLPWPGRRAGSGLHVGGVSPRRARRLAFAGAATHGRAEPGFPPRGGGGTAARCGDAGRLAPPHVPGPPQAADLPVGRRAGAGRAGGAERGPALGEPPPAADPAAVAAGRDGGGRGRDQSVRRGRLRPGPVAPPGEPGRGPGGGGGRDRLRRGVGPAPRGQGHEPPDLRHRHCDHAGRLQDGRGHGTHRVLRVPGGPAYGGARLHQDGPVPPGLHHQHAGRVPERRAVRGALGLLRRRSRTSGTRRSGSSTT